MLVQSFRSKLLALAENELVEVGQYGGIEADGIFHQHDHLYADFLNIMLQVHLVFYQLDDGHQQIGVSQPAEHILEDAQVFMLHSFLDAMRERCQYHQRKMRIFLFNIAGNVEGIAIVRARHTDNQVEHGVAQLFPGFFCRRDLRETRRIAQTQVHIFIENLFVNAAVIFQHERIVRVGHQQYVEYTLCHQVGKLRILEIQLTEFNS